MLTNAMTNPNRCAPFDAPEHCLTRGGNSWTPECLGGEDFFDVMIEEGISFGKSARYTENDNA